MAFYSISDIADRLLSTPAHPIPSLEEGYWLGRCPPDHPHQAVVQALLDELSPPAMAAFDLACCHCTLWKTSRQLLDTAERRLNASLEARGELGWGGVGGDRGIGYSWLVCVLCLFSRLLTPALGYPRFSFSCWLRWPQPKEQSVDGIVSNHSSR